MAKKKRKTTKKEGDILDNIPKFTLVASALHKIISKLLDKIEETLNNAEEKTLQIVLSVLMFMLAVVFMSTALIKLMTYYMDFPTEGWSYFIVGIVLLVWGMMLKSKKLKR